MAEISDYDFEGYGKLPQSVIKAAAAEYLVKYLLPEIEAFFSFAVDALAHDCDIEAAEAESVIIERLQTMTSRLKPGQYTVNHAAILFRLWGLFDERQGKGLFEINQQAKDWLIDETPGQDKPQADDKPAPSAQQDKPQYWQVWRPDDSDNETSSN